MSELPSSMPALPAPRALSIVAPHLAPSALPGLPSHVELARVSEQYNAGRFGVDATVSVPALDVEIMNEMAQVVVVAHTVASHISESLVWVTGMAGSGSMETRLVPSQERMPPPSVAAVVTEMGQFVVILHRLAERMNFFQGTMDSTRQLIREARLLATDLQGEIEEWKLTNEWKSSASLRAVTRQCRVVATELQNEIETRRGPRG